MTYQHSTIFKIAIIGCGSKCISILESLVNIDDKAPRAIEVSLYDERLEGQGVHNDNLKQYLKLNTAAGELTCFPKRGKEKIGLSFFDWCQVNSVEVNSINSNGKLFSKKIESNHFATRAELGKYLKYSFDTLVNLPMKNIKYNLNNITVREIIPVDGKYKLISSLGESSPYDAVVIAIGHGSSQINCVNDSNASEKIIFINGLGLTAIDAISALTKGKGGKFINSDAGLKYIKSGREPSKILMHSKSTIPYRSRPIDLTNHTDIPQNIVFNSDFVAKYKDKNNIDFYESIFPVIETEVRIQYAMKTAELEGTCLKKFIVASKLTAKELNCWLDDNMVSSFFDITDLNLNANDYGESFKIWIQEDLKASLAGKENNARKHALEVFRNSRNLVRKIVNNGNLSNSSANEFFKSYASLSNKVVGGPECTRYAELLALIDCGLLVPCNIEPKEFDIKLDCFVGNSSKNFPDDSLPKNLLDSSIAKYEYTKSIGGLSVDTLCQLKSPIKGVNKNLFAIGPLIEGSTFYNHYITTNSTGCYSVVEANNIVTEILNNIKPKENIQELVL